jgi:hypothetical protein
MPVSIASTSRAAYSVAAPIGPPRDRRIGGAPTVPAAVPTHTPMMRGGIMFGASRRALGVSTRR